MIYVKLGVATSRVHSNLYAVVELLDDGRVVILQDCMTLSNAQAYFYRLMNGLQC